MKKNPLTIVLGLTASVGLVGCLDDSDSDSSSGSASSTSYSVTAIDGYLNGAQVWLDLNANFQLDSNEPSATTGEGGKASLDITGIDNPETYPLVVRSIKGQTVDEDTGNTVASDYVMSAPAGERDVTPLSTLVHVQLESGQAASKEEAVTNVATEMGLEEEEVLGDYKEKNNEKAAFGARSLVASGNLPESPEELETAANDDDGSNDLLAAISVVNSKIKEIVEDNEADLDSIVFNKSGVADKDTDKDGVADEDDAFPSDDSEWLDSDNDEIGDNADTDDDGDGVSDTEDEMPLDPNETKDSDSDGKGDNADLDDDNDGVPDTEDAFDFDPTETLDTDNDGIGNNTDEDDDGDEVNDEEDAFPLDSSESVDTDEDNIGNNADTDDDGDGVSDEEDDFPLDKDESLDTDKDGIGNNADTDDDGDEVSDEDDAFPLDSSESVDTDKDNIGNNADTDDDGDGVSDEEDDFPLDKDESVDTDKDGIGNNADPDDDNDGIDDENDLDPTDPDVGLSDTAKAIEFIKSESAIYSLWEEDYDKITQLFIDTFTPNGDVAPLTQIQRVKSDGTLITVPNDYESDTQLTEQGWTSIPEEYVLDISDSKIMAYPVDHPTLTYSATAIYKDLSGVSISSYNLDLDLLEDSQGSYPDGSTAVVLNFTPVNDAYYLWTNWTPWVFDGHNGKDNATLDELIVDTSAGEVGQTSMYYGVSIGWDVSAELVSDNTVNFYSLNWNDGEAVRVSSATWTRSTMNNEDIIMFTVPEEALTEWGESFDQDSPHVLFSVVDGQLHQGSLEKAGEPEVDESIYINAIARDAALNIVDVPVSTCSTGDDEDETATTQEFEAAVTACGGRTTITEQMIVDQNFHRVKGNGDTRDYFFNADGTVDVSKNGEYGYTDNWSINNGQVVISFSEPDYEFAWTWALVEQSDSVWSLKFYESEVDGGQEKQWIWSDTVELVEGNVICSFPENSSASLDSFKNDLSEYSDCAGEPLTSELSGLQLGRVKSNGETRGYQFNDDGTAINYRNGIPRYWVWEFDTDNNMYVVYYDEEKTELAEYITVLYNTDGSVSLAFYEPEASESWASTYEDLSTSNGILYCDTGNTDWNDEDNVPNYGSFQDYKDSVESCIELSDSNAAFSADYFDRKISFTSNSDEDGEFETFVFEEDGTGSYIVSHVDDGDLENLTMTWTVNDETNLVDVVIDAGEVTARDTLAIIDSNSIEFSIKGFSRGSDWDGVGDDDGGDIWSRIFTADQPSD